MFAEDDLRAVVESELERGEKVLWTASPNPVRMMAYALLRFVFGIVWTAGIVNFIYMWHDGMNNVQGPGGLFGMHGLLADLAFLPFLLIGAGMLLSPMHYYRTAKRTIYAVTDKRVLIVCSGRYKKVQSYGPADICEPERAERADGSGDLTFARRVYRDGDGDRRMEAIQFVGIPDVRSVEKLLRELFSFRCGI